MQHLHKPPTISPRETETELRATSASQHSRPLLAHSHLTPRLDLEASRASYLLSIWRLSYSITHSPLLGIHCRQFESLVIHCARFQSVLPVSFVLGFYVSLVVGRWWDTYQKLPWPDSTAILLATHLPGQVTHNNTLDRLPTPWPCPA